MSGACTEIKKTASLVAIAKLALYGGSDEYNQAHVRAGEIIYGQRDREPRSDVDEDALAKKEIAAWAKTDAKAAAGGRAPEVDQEFAERREQAYAQHLQHSGCRNAILAVHDLSDVGRLLIPQQEEHLDGEISTRSKKAKLEEQALFGDNSHLLFEARFKTKKKTGVNKFVEINGERKNWSNKIGPELRMTIAEAAVALIENVAYVHVIVFDNEKKQRLKARVQWIEPVEARETGAQWFRVVVKSDFGEWRPTTLEEISMSNETIGRVILERVEPRNPRAKERADEAFRRWRDEGLPTFGLMVVDKPQDGFYVITTDTEGFLRQLISDAGSDPDKAMKDLFGEDD